MKFITSLFTRTPTINPGANGASVQHGNAHGPRANNDQGYQLIMHSYHIPSDITAFMLSKVMMDAKLNLKTISNLCLTCKAWYYWILNNYLFIKVEKTVENAYGSGIIIRDTFIQKMLTSDIVSRSVICYETSKAQFNLELSKKYLETLTRSRDDPNSNMHPSAAQSMLMSELPVYENLLAAANKTSKFEVSKKLVFAYNSTHSKFLANEYKTIMQDPIQHQAAVNSFIKAINNNPQLQTVKFKCMSLEMVDVKRIANECANHPSLICIEFDKRESDNTTDVNMFSFDNVVKVFAEKSIHVQPGKFSIQIHCSSLNQSDADVAKMLASAPCPQDFTLGFQGFDDLTGSGLIIYIPKKV